MIKKREVYVVLPDIRSVYNVGSIFRTADAAGVKKIFLCGYTPTPVDQFGRKRKDLGKVSLGAEDAVPWEYIKSATTLLRRLKKEKVSIIAVEQDPRSVHFKKVKIKYPVFFVFGNEVDGIPKKLLKYADYIAEIPMAGKKESLNVSVTAGIVLFNN